MTTDEALKLAIDALKDAFYEKADEAKKALAEPEWAELTRGEILSWEMPAVSSVVEFVWFVERNGMLSHVITLLFRGLLDSMELFANTKYLNSRNRTNATINIAPPWTT